MKSRNFSTPNRIVIMACTGLLTAPLAIAAPIDNACNRTGLSSSAQLCHCIQQVADQILSNSDQRRAAGLISNPQKAQDVRVSKSDADSAFWSRYEQFASTAEDYCG